MLQLSFNSALAGREDEAVSCETLVDLRQGEQAFVEAIDLPEDVSRRLMELGFIPGGTVTAGRSAPGGDPKVFQVDGSEIALRRETAAHVRVRR